MQGRPRRVLRHAAEYVSYGLVAPGSMRWPMASSSSSIRAASGQSPAAAACRTASARYPLRRYQMAARR